MTSLKQILRHWHLAISSINRFIISFLAPVFINTSPFELYCLSEMPFFAARGALVTRFDFSYSLWESPSQDLSNGTSFVYIALRLLYKSGVNPKSTILISIIPLNCVHVMYVILKHFCDVSLLFSLTYNRK